MEIKSWKRSWWKVALMALFWPVWGFSMWNHSSRGKAENGERLFFVGLLAFLACLLGMVIVFNYYINPGRLFWWQALAGLYIFVLLILAISQYPKKYLCKDGSECPETRCFHYHECPYKWAPKEEEISRRNRSPITYLVIFSTFLFWIALLLMCFLLF